MTTLRITLTSNTKNCMLFLLCLLTSIIKTFQEEVRAVYFWIIIEILVYAFFLASVLMDERGKHILFRFIKQHPIIVILYINAYLQVLLGEAFGYNEFDLRTLRLLILWALCVLIGYAVAYCNKYTLRSIIKVFVILGVLNAIYSLWEAYVNTNIFWAFYSRMHSGGNNYRTSAAFINPIPFSTMLIILFWMLAYIQKEKSNYILFLIIIFAIVFTRSRSAWIALGVTCVLKLMSQLYRNHKITLRRFCIVVGILMLSTLVYYTIPFIRSTIEMILVRFSDITGSISQTQRLGSISYVLNDFFGNTNPFFILFGKGTGAVNILMLKTVITIEDFSTTDNQFLTIIYEYGIITFLAVIFMIVRMVKQVFVTKYREVYYINLALIGFWACSFFYESLTWGNVSCFPLILTGVWLRYQEKDCRIPKPIRRQQKMLDLA